MENRIYTQEELELVIIRTMDFFEGTTLSLDEWAKIDEEDPETIPAKGTRHPSTRQERRKKTAHAKTRHSVTLRTRELRKYPYSLMLGKGKKHDHVWIGEASITEIRLESRYQSELRDFTN